MSPCVVRCVEGCVAVRVLRMDMFLRGLKDKIGVPFRLPESVESPSDSWSLSGRGTLAALGGRLDVGAVWRNALTCLLPPGRMPPIDVVPETFAALRFDCW